MKNTLLKRLALRQRTIIASAMGALASGAIARPAFAHHPLGGQAPQTLFEGFLSGLGHPVIGLDHLAFVVAAGLLAAVVAGGRWVPTAFIAATLAGTGAHLTGLSLPAPELVIATSVVMFGGLAVMRDRLNPAVVCLLAAIAGLFHGYAYGEAVVGAEAAPLVAYLLGFAGVQGAITYGAYLCSQRAIHQNQSTGLISVRHAGFAILGVGAALLSGLVA